MTVQRRLQLLKIVAQFLQDNLTGDCSDIEPPVKELDVRDAIFRLRVFAHKRLDMQITDAEAVHVNLVIKGLFNQAFNEGMQ